MTSSLTADRTGESGSFVHRVFNRLFVHIARTPGLDLAMRMTLVLLLLHTPSRARTFSIAIAAAGLVLPRLQRFGLFWITIALSRFLLLIPETWHVIDNHQYPIIYWCVALGVAQFTSDPGRTAGLSGRILIGLAFLFATLWKIASPDFLNGSFMEFTLISDSRFAWFSELVGGLTADQLEANADAVTTLRATTDPVSEVPLHSSDTLGWIGPIISYWTILLEAAIAVAFLTPRNWMARHRDIILLFFVITTYPIASVIGFGWLLVAMGISQVDETRGGLKAAFVAVFIVLPFLEQ